MLDFDPRSQAGCADVCRHDTVCIPICCDPLSQADLERPCAWPWIRHAMLLRKSENAKLPDKKGN